MPKKPTIRNHFSIVMMSATLTINGQVHELQGVNYQREEREDGTVVETGRPPGLPADAGVDEVIAHAFKILDDTKAKKGKKARR